MRYLKECEAKIFRLRPALTLVVLWGSYYVGNNEVNQCYHFFNLFKNYIICVVRIVLQKFKKLNVVVNVGLYAL